MKILELSKALEKSRKDFLKMLELIPPEQLEVPGASGYWTVKDVLAHLSLWEAEVVTVLYQLKNNLPVNIPEYTDQTIDQQNKTWYEQTKDRDYETVLNDFVNVRKQTLRRLQAFKDRELDNPDQFPELKGKSLENFLLIYTITHENEHASLIKNWLKNQPVLDD